MPWQVLSHALKVWERALTRGRDVVEALEDLEAAQAVIQGTPQLADSLGR